MKICEGDVQRWNKHGDGHGDGAMVVVMDGSGDGWYQLYHPGPYLGSSAAEQKIRLRAAVEQLELL